MVQAIFGSTSVECILDTGCSESTWPASLKIEGKTTGEASTLTDILGHTANEMRMILPQVRIGGYEAFQVPGFAVDYDNKKVAVSANADKIPLLTNSAFSHVVLTIDYYKRELTLRNPAYDFLREPRKQGDQVIPFAIADAEKDFTWGVPVIQGYVAGQPVRLVLDTGWSSDGFALFRPFAERTLQQQLGYSRAGGAASITKTTIIKGAGTLGTGSIAITDALPIEIGRSHALSFNQPAQLIYPCIVEADGIFGYSILRNFRVTIDYPRKRVLLEPYGEDAVKVLDKNEEFTIK